VPPRTQRICLIRLDQLTNSMSAPRACASKLLALERGDQNFESGSVDLIMVRFLNFKTAWNLPRKEEC